MHLADYLDLMVEYLPADERAEFATLADTVEAADSVTSEVYAQLLELGRKSFPMRRAVAQFVEDEGAEDEWREVMHHARPTTILLLRRLKNNPEVVRAGLKPAPTLGDALNSDQATYAFHDAEEAELELLRAETHLKLWLEHQEKLRSHLEEAQKEFEAVTKHVQALRENNKLPDDLEYRIFIQGERVI